MEWNVIWSQSLTSDIFGGKLAPKGKTVCFSVKAGLSGKGLRFRFSNERGKKPYVIGALAVVKDGKVSSVNHDGKEEIVVLPRTAIYTDELNISLGKGDEIQIRLYLKTNVMDINNIESRAFVCSGNAAHVMTAKALNSRPNFFPYIPSLDRIEILSEQTPLNIVVFGDSITAMSRWTKSLSERMFEVYDGRYTLLNAGISGNGMLTEWENSKGQNRLIKDMYGIKGVKRFEKDVLGFDKISTVVFALGLNDITNMGDSTMSEINTNRLISETVRLAELSKAKGIRVGIQTVTPVLGSTVFSTQYENERRRYNTWVRKECKKIFDFILDFEPVLISNYVPAIKEEYHQGDYVHPNENGGRAIAESICLEEITGEKKI